jgi:hypothetical protein
MGMHAEFNARALLFRRGVGLSNIYKDDFFLDAWSMKILLPYLLWQNLNTKPVRVIITPRKKQLLLLHAASVNSDIIR